MEEVHATDDHLPPMFGYPGPDMAGSEIRESAFEFLVWACWCCGSKMKKALRLKTGFGTTGGRSKMLAVLSKELVGVQMGILKDGFTRLGHAFRGIADHDDLHGRPMESVILPLELIQQFRISDFPSQQEYEACLRRNLKVLEAGLHLHPHLSLDSQSTCEGRLQRIIREAIENPMDIGRSNESKQAFRSEVMSLAFRPSGGSSSASETACRWAVGFPMNLWFYQALLGACFDVRRKTFVREEVDEVLELIKKTWFMLGINDMLHNICFSWVLFHRFVTTGQVEIDLLVASRDLLAQVEKDTKAMKDPMSSKTVDSALRLMLSWADRRLNAYRDAFRCNIESLEGLVSLAVLSAEILAECNPKRKEADAVGTTAEHCIKSYIRSSLGAVFAQTLEKLNPIKNPSRKQNGALCTLAVLAQYIIKLAFSEKEIFSPKLKIWHPFAAGVAAAALHEFYGLELKKHVESISELKPDAIEVLLAADKLEEVLLQIAVEDSISIDSEDGGKSFIREIQPYEAKALLTKLVKSWINIRVERLKEWVARNLQPEVWNLPTNEEGFVPSAVEVLKAIEDTLEESFSLPIDIHAILLPDLLSGLEKFLQQYILKATTGYGGRDTFIPAKPALTRCSAGSKSHGAIQRKAKLQTAQRREVQVGTTNAGDSFDMPQLCVRINTLAKIFLELKVLENQTLEKLGSSKSTGVSLKFELSSAAAFEGIHKLYECIAYKVVFQDLRHVLGDGLYVGEISSSRIEPFLQELKKFLETISLTPLRDKEPVVIEVMRASFDGFLLVLLAGGPSRAFSLQDSTIIEEDFKSLTDLFGSNGEGLPAEVIQELSATVRAVIPLFSTETEHIIQQLTQFTKDMYGSSVKSRLPLPPASDQWSPREPDTLLRVLCYRNDKKASKFLKKKYSLPKNV